MKDHKKNSTKDDYIIRKRKAITSALVKRKLRGLNPKEAAAAQKLAQEDIKSGRASTRVSAGISVLRGILGSNSLTMMDYDPTDSILIFDVLGNGGSPPDGDGLITIDMTDSTD